VLDAGELPDLKRALSACLPAGVRTRVYAVAERPWHELDRKLAEETLGRQRAFAIIQVRSSYLNLQAVVSSRKGTPAVARTASPLGASLARRCRRDKHDRSSAP